MNKIIFFILSLAIGLISGCKYRYYAENINASAIRNTGKTFVTGKISDIEGNPISGADLLIQDWNERGGGGEHYREEAKSDEKGQFLISAQPSDSRLFVGADGYASMTRTNEVFKGVNIGSEIRTSVIF